MEESDGAVIAGSLETPGAFGVIFDRHGSTLLRFLARRVDPAEAEDLLGEVFRIAFERRSAFERDRDEGAQIVTPLEDMFWGDRRYEALDLEGHRWHFAERLSEIRP